MCLIVFAYKAHPDHKLVLAANRDEFYKRPTSVAKWWEDQPNILGGRDLKAKGTWMGINKNGRFASVTNYRDLSNNREDAKSRGDLPAAFLLNGESPKAYMKELSGNGEAYNGFNLLVLDEDMAHISNYENKTNILKPGIYGLSNALLDTPWPKVRKAKQLFEHQLTSGFSTQSLLEMMEDTSAAPDEDLPHTGLSPEMEHALSAMCIRTPNYGTCCSTVVTIKYDNQAQFVERSYPVGDRKDETVSYFFQIEK